MACTVQPSYALYSRYDLTTRCQQVNSVEPCCLCESESAKMGIKCQEIEFKYYKRKNFWFGLVFQFSAETVLALLAVWYYCVCYVMLLLYSAGFWIQKLSWMIQFKRCTLLRQLPSCTTSSLSWTRFSRCCSFLAMITQVSVCHLF